uniref:Sulfotransferase n=1 Tax=Oryza brachyantha TaxID=4533 RepID=J3MCZ7_ORYBR
MVVSWWHYSRRREEKSTATFAEVVESCSGVRLYGPFWEHILGYWHASAARPDNCLPFLEGLFISNREAMLDALPSPRLINTHMPFSMLPSTTTTAGGGCRVIYICREPKDMVVSWWHYSRRREEKSTATFAEVVESCSGVRLYGPFWEHILGYWHASAARPDNELLRDPAGNVGKLARFVGLPFSAAEEEAGVVESIVELCSLDYMKSIEANKTGFMDPVFKIPRAALFRKGMTGDWANHMTRRWHAASTKSSPTNLPLQGSRLVEHHAKLL